MDFWAEWCGPCRQVAPILDEIAAEHGDKITFVKMNVDENPVTPAAYRVTGIPTINVYQGGEVVKQIVGAKPKAALLSELERVHRLTQPARASAPSSRDAPSPTGDAGGRRVAPSSGAAAEVCRLANDRAFCLGRRIPGPVHRPLRAPCHSARTREEVRPSEPHHRRTRHRRSSVSATAAAPCPRSGPASPCSASPTTATAAGTPTRTTFDERLDQAVRAFQQQRGLAVDGIVGPSTYRVLEEARWRLGDRLLTHVAGNLLAGDDVLALQQRLLDLGFKVGKVDGRFGHQTEQAVRDFQRNVGVPADGTCGPATLKALARLAPMVRGGSPNAMRAEERIRRDGPQLTGKIVVIDPSVGRFADSAMRLRADAITTDLARRIEGRLVATGVQAFLTNTGGASETTEVERAEFANRTDAHLCISLQVDGSDNAGRAPASRRTSTARRRTASPPRPASGSPVWSSGRSWPAPTSATCARTPRPSTSCGAPRCPRSGSTPATSPTPATPPGWPTRLPRRDRRGGRGRRAAGLPRRPTSDAKTGVLRLSELRAALALPPALTRVRRWRRRPVVTA